MKRLVFILSALLVVAGAGSASAQYGGDYDYQISRSLDDIAWELYQQRMDRTHPEYQPIGYTTSYSGYRGSYGGCAPGYGFFMVSPPRPSKHAIREYKQHYYRYERAQANRKKRGLP